MGRVERAFGTRILARGAGFSVEGSDPGAQAKTGRVLSEMVRIAEETGELDGFVVDLLVKGSAPNFATRPILYDVRGQAVRPRSAGQHRLVETASTHELVFAIGPAGTGKTYLAIALAVAALERREVDRLVLVRPAVEAGEELGFLPGDLQEKIAPYLQPMMDALQELLPRNRFKECREAGLIEMAPLAYMRGRTLKRCFAILDEAQNATIPQMRMFLTRLGEGSKCVVTGDPSQVDLPHNRKSGLIESMQALHGTEGIFFTKFDEVDVIRHELVQRIIRAYKAHRGEKTTSLTL